MTEIGSYGKFLVIYRYDSYPDFTQNVGRSGIDGTSKAAAGEYHSWSNPCYPSFPARSAHSRFKSCSLRWRCVFTFAGLKLVISRA
jgi:hypothetical protein